MNKAFVREADDSGAAYCPRCGSLGTAVSVETLAAQLDGEARSHLADAAYYCPYPKCEVAYFDRFEQTVPTGRLRQPAYPKDLAAPLCNCFGFGTADIDADLHEGSTTRTKEHLARAKSPAAHCVTAAPDGRCCAAEVQRYFMRARAGHGPTE